MNIYKQFMELMDKREEWDPDEFMNLLDQIIYCFLEEQNYHSFNWLFIAYLHGTYEEIEKAAKIMLEHEKAGHSLPQNIKWRKEHLGKYLDDFLMNGYELFKEAANE